jgi:hypothetical protein
VVVFAINLPLGPLAGGIEVQFYGGRKLLGSKFVKLAAGANGFIGATSTVPISHVRLLYTTTDDMTMATNIAFGAAAVRRPAAKSGKDQPAAPAGRGTGQPAASTPAGKAASNPAVGQINQQQSVAPINQLQQQALGQINQLQQLQRAKGARR